MARSTEFIVYRVGSNAANQPRCQEAPIEILTAETREQACELAAARHTVYANQYLYAKPRSRASTADVNEAIDSSEERDLLDQERVLLIAQREAADRILRAREQAEIEAQLAREDEEFVTP